MPSVVLRNSRRGPQKRVVLGSRNPNEGMILPSDMTLDAATTWACGSFGGNGIVADRGDDWARVMYRDGDTVSLYVVTVQHAL